MTPVDRWLGPERLSGNSQDLFRLTTRKYAELTGKVAALSPGRWNRHGEEAIYTSLDMATTVLERLAHTPKQKIPSNLAMMRIQFAGSWAHFGEVLTDEATGATRIMLPSLDAARRAFANPSHPVFQCCAVALPSIILPVWNVVLYPQRIGFWTHTTLASTEASVTTRGCFPKTPRQKSSG